MIIKIFKLKNLIFLRISGLKVVIDCANGSVYQFCTKFFRKFGCKLIVF